MSDIELHFSSCEVSKRYVTLTVRVATKRPIDLKDAYVDHPGTKFFQPTREYLKYSTTAVLHLNPWAYVSLRDLPSSLQVILYAPSGQSLCTRSVALEASKFADHLYEDPEGAPCNILLFGLAGSSKSSFINSCYAMLSGATSYKQIAISGGNSARVTTEYNGNRLINLNDKRPTRYRLWDTWGLERNNYQDCQFEFMLSGQLNRKFKMNDDVSQVKYGDPKQKIHCVLFFIPAAELDLQSSPMLQKTKEFREISTRMGIPFVVAITKVDSKVPAFRDDSSIKQQAIDQMITRAAQVFNIQENRIRPLINHTAEKEKTFSVDVVVLELLDVAISVAGSRTLDEDLIALINS